MWENVPSVIVWSLDQALGVGMTTVAIRVSANIKEDIPIAMGTRAYVTILASVFMDTVRYAFKDVVSSKRLFAALAGRATSPFSAIISR